MSSILCRTQGRHLVKTQGLSLSEKSQVTKQIPNKQMAPALSLFDNRILLVIHRETLTRQIPQHHSFFPNPSQPLWFSW